LLLLLLLLKHGLRLLHEEILFIDGDGGYNVSTTISISDRALTSDDLCCLLIASSNGGHSSHAADHA
jgi:hypothetical protein